MSNGVILGDATHRAYGALRIAAERIGMNNYSAGYDAHIKAGRSKRTYRYVPTPAHILVVEAMPKLAGGEITPEEAMALLHTHDVFKERMGT
jgi:hypothetical protein